MEEKERFYEELQEMVDEAKHRENLIMMGDWNGHVGRERDGYEGVVGAHGIGDRNDDGRRVLDFCLLNDAAIMNTFYQHQESHKWTWYGWNQEELRYTRRSMIDLFITNKKKIFKDVKAIPSVSADSDHRIVVAKLSLTKPKQKARRGRMRLKLENLKDEEKRRELQNKVENHTRTQREEQINAQWETFRETLLQICTETLGTKTIKGTKKKQTPWWTGELKGAVRRKMQAFRKWMKTRHPNDRAAYIVERETTEDVKKRCKREAWEKIGKDLEEDMNGTKKLLFSMAKNFRRGEAGATYTINDENGILLVEEEQIAGR